MSQGFSIIKDTLDRKIALIKDIKIEADFFLEVCNYLILLISDIRLKHIIAQIIHEREETHKSYNKLQQEVLSGFNEIRNSLRELLKQHGVDENQIQTLEHFDKLGKGEIQISYYHDRWWLPKQSRSL